MNKIINFLKKRWILIFLYFFVLGVCLIDLPYYIDAPGGLINVDDKIEFDGKYESSGSINLAYVKEYNVNLPLLIASYFIDDWTLHKIETEEDLINYEETLIRDKLLNKESYASAVILAFQYAGKDVEILDSDIYVSHIYEEADTNLVVGDQILSIDDNPITKKSEISLYLNQLESGTRINIVVENDGIEYERYANIIEVEGIKLIGIVPVEIKHYKTTPEINIKSSKSEYGPSGGLMIALAVYDAITEKDITGGLTIVGTGTIDIDGNVGSIGGVEYKIKGAEKKGADIFFVPRGENYEEAKKIVEEEHYEIKLIPVSTFEEALNYLLENVVE